jgi:hypothetical protein
MGEIIGGLKQKAETRILSKDSIQKVIDSKFNEYAQFLCDDLDAQK